MSTWSLAIRNLLRNRRRSLATLLALAVGSASILIFGGYTTNVSYSMTTAYVRAGGHLQVQYRDFFYYGSGNPAAYGITNYETILTAIRNDAALKKLVTVTTPMLQFGGIAGNYAAGVSRTVVGSGYVATDVNKMRLWNEFALRDKRPYFVLEGATPDAAIVGLGVARVLLLCEPLGVDDCPRPSATVVPESSPAVPADIAALSQLEAPEAPSAKAGGKARIELLAGNARGAPNVATLSVVAAESQGFKELDELAVILQLEQAQQLVYGRTAPRATAILVQLENTASMNEAQDRIAALLAKIPSDKPLTIQSFEALNPFYVQSRQLLDTIFGFIFVLIGGIVLFTVGNTMNAAVVERTVEIGTLRAIGLRQAGIRRLFLAEGFLLGCLGAVLGVVAALGVAVGFNGLNLTWIPPGTSELVPLGLQVWGQTRMIVGTTVGLITIAVASAWLPAYRAAGLKIVEALRHADQLSPARRWRRVFVLGVCSLAGALAPDTKSLANPSAQAILAASDALRNPGQPFKVTITLTEFEKGQQVDSSTLTSYARTIDASGQFASLVRFVQPARDTGKLMLKSGNDLWFFDPGTKASVRISPQQRLMGQASNGDVITVNFARDYKATIAGEETIQDGERRSRRTLKLALAPTNEDATYAGIELWVDADSSAPLKSKLFADSGRLLKTAYYRRYQMQMGAERPTETVIIDGLNPQSVTLLRFSDFSARSMPVSWFQRDYLPRFQPD